MHARAHAVSHAVGAGQSGRACAGASSLLVLRAPYCLPRCAAPRAALDRNCACASPTLTLLPLRLSHQDIILLLFRLGLAGARAVRGSWRGRKHSCQRGSAGGKGKG